MLDEKQKKDLKEFWHNLGILQLRWPGISTEELFELGLIILEEGTKVTVKNIEDFFSKLTAGKVEILDYKDNIREELFFERLVAFLQEEKSVIINLQIDPSHQLINQLRNLQDRNLIQLFNFAGEKVFNFKLSEKSKVVVMVKHNFLEKGISYHRFLDIFGPLIRL